MFLTLSPLVWVHPDLLIYNFKPKTVKSTDGGIHRLVLAKCEVEVEVPNITSGGRDITAVALNCRTVVMF